MKRARREKALRILGTTTDAFERRKALGVLGLREEDVEESRRFFFVFPGRNAVSLPSFADEEEGQADPLAHIADIRPSSVGAEPEEAASPDAVDVLAEGPGLGQPRGPFHARRRSSLPVPVRPKAVRVLGMDQQQVARVKALALLGVSDYEVDEDTSRALGRLGVQNRENSPASRCGSNR